MDKGTERKDHWEYQQSRKYSYIVEEDIRGLFEAKNHDWLIRMLETGNLHSR